MLNRFAPRQGRKRCRCTTQRFTIDIDHRIPLTHVATSSGIPLEMSSCGGVLLDSKHKTLPYLILEHQLKKRHTNAWT
jgi:hypothetical protein